MPTWNPQQYLTYADERGRPMQDLLQRISTDPVTIADLGCGPGQLSALIRRRWPDADLVGIDASAEMIDRAQADNTDPHTHYVLGDVAGWSPQRPVDLIVSNATFQWVPDQLTIIPRLRDHLTPGGVLAFSVPNNYSAPSHQLLYQLADTEPYRDQLRAVKRRRGTDATAYLRLLADPDWQVEAWSTTYCHVLGGPDPVFRWVSGTGARPFLQALDDELRPRFERAYAQALRDAYPAESFGTVLEFERVFVVARHLAHTGTGAD